MTHISLFRFHHLKNIYIFRDKYLTNENNQVIRMYDFKIDINNIGDIISAEIYLKNKKLYLFNYTFLMILISEKQK